MKKENNHGMKNAKIRREKRKEKKKNKLNGKGLSMRKVRVRIELMQSTLRQTIGITKMNTVTKTMKIEWPEQYDDKYYL